MMYWWALGIGVAVLGTSIYLGKRKGLLGDGRNGSNDLTENLYDEDKINLDEEVEQGRNLRNEDGSH